MAKAARDAYENAAEADKLQLAGMAIKISYFLEAVDRYCISGILQGEREKRLDIKAPDFLSAPENMNESRNSCRKFITVFYAP